MSAGEFICVSDLLQCLVESSSRASVVSQAFRSSGGSELFALLVEEKDQVVRNQRFVRDFKTLADVLVQEAIKRDVAERFPSLLSNIRGEEQNSFQNSLGECIRVELTPSPSETRDLLSKVLDGRDDVAESLARAVHADDIVCERQSDSNATVKADTIGIWIDPIDSTAEYIQGKYDDTEEYGIRPYGLRCVCVLIGVYDLKTGIPIIGVVNQPFFHRTDVEPNRWESAFYWAIHRCPETSTSTSLLNADPNRDQHQKVAVLSSSENDTLRDIVRTRYRVVHAAGAGYKSLLVACKKADLYVLSQGTTYFWDTCGPHAILASQGGGILRFDETLNAQDLNTAEDVRRREIRYLCPLGAGGTKSFQNTGGIISYRDPGDVLELIRLLRESGYVQKCK